MRRFVALASVAVAVGAGPSVGEDFSAALEPVLPSSTAKFLILTTPRSGSTWLVKWSTAFAASASRFGEIVTAGEVLHAHELARSVGVASADDLALPEYLRYLRRTYAAVRNPNRFKIPST